MFTLGLEPLPFDLDAKPLYSELLSLLKVRNIKWSFLNVSNSFG